MDEPHPHVLLVETDLFFAGRILSVLKKAGYRVSTAASAQQAVQAAERDRPDVVMLNLATERLGGVALIGDLKSLDSAPRVLAYLSHVRIPAVRDEVLAAGADRLCPNSAVSLRLPDIMREILAGAGPIEDSD